MAEKKEYKNALQPGYELVGGDHAYTIEQVLGQGGFGITYRVTAKIKAGNITIKTKFAVKEFFPSECWREPGSPLMRYSPNQTDEIREGLADFVNEGRRLQMVCQKNSNIVNVNEVFQDKATGTAYFVMEYLEGGDLCSIVRASGGGMSETALMSFLNPIAHAVQSLHEDNMLHLDIKPENIVMRRSDDPTEADIPVLIDFGIAVHFRKDGSPTTKNPNKGTSQGYSPIEQYAGVSRFAPQYDIYALAATCFYMLTSRDPKSAFEVSASDIRNELNGKASERTVDAIVRGMSKDASDRPKSIDQFLKGFKESNALRIGHIVQGTYQNYLIVAVMEETEDHILYKATTVSNQGDSRSTHATRKTSYYLWEQFSPALGDIREKDGQVVVSTQNRPEWLIPSQKGGFEYSKYGTKNNKSGALDCEYFVNGTQYLAVRENYKPTPQWQKNLTQALDKIHPMQLLEKNKKKLLIGAASVLAVAVVFAGIKYWQEIMPNHSGEDDAAVDSPLVDVPANTLNIVDDAAPADSASIEEEVAEPSAPVAKEAKSTNNDEQSKIEKQKQQEKKKEKEEVKSNRETVDKNKTTSKSASEPKKSKENNKTTSQTNQRETGNSSLNEQARKAYKNGDAATLQRLARNGNSAAKEFCSKSGIDY